MSAEVAAQPVPGQEELLDREALNLIAELEHRFGGRRRALLLARDRLGRDLGAHAAAR